MVTFGKLERVAIRDGWPREDKDFSQWLVQSENLAALCAETGIPLEVIDTEVYVGAYRADILAKRSGTDEMVVIENQFGKTDHDHLGKLMTYAADVGSDGTGARTMIWIAEKFTDPHRAALDWLNKCTLPEIRFYGAELELWKIGNSPYAPKFNLTSKPNDWQKALSQQTAAASGLYELYQQFWAEFIAFCGSNTVLQLEYGAPMSHWLAVYAIKPGFGINLTTSKRAGVMECQLWIESADAKNAFDQLLIHRDNLLASLGPDLVFDRKEDKRPCAIYQSVSSDVMDKATWPTMHQWLKDCGEKYVQVFSPIVKNLTVR